MFSEMLRILVTNDTIKASGLSLPAGQFLRELSLGILYSPRNGQYEARWFMDHFCIEKYIAILKITKPKVNFPEVVLKTLGSSFRRLQAGRHHWKNSQIPRLTPCTQGSNTSQRPLAVVNS